MKEHPILFKTEMVQAILEGRKTQTRRVLKLRNPRNPLSPSSWLCLKTATCLKSWVIASKVYQLISLYWLFSGFIVHTLKNTSSFRKSYFCLIVRIVSSTIRNAEGYCTKAHSSALFLFPVSLTNSIQSKSYALKSSLPNCRLISSYVISLIFTPTRGYLNVS